MHGWRACAVGAAIVAMLACAARAPAATLVGHWPLDATQNMGGQTADVSGAGNTGQVIGAPDAVAGRIGAGAFAFDGSGERVFVHGVPALAPARISVLAWVRGSYPGQNRHVVSKEAIDCFGSAWALRAFEGGLEFYVGDDTGPLARSPNAGAGVWDGAWHAVAGTFDGARLRLYVDGREVGSGTPAAVTPGYGQGEGELTFGSYAAKTCPGGPAHYAGALDDVRLYDDALTPAEIQAAQPLGDAPSPPPPPPPAPTPPPAAPEAPYVPARAAVTPSATRLRAGAYVRLDASASLPTGAVAREFAWNLDGDPAPEARCGPETPVLETNFARPGAVVPRLTVTDVRGATTSAAVSLAVARAAAPRSGAAPAGRVGAALRTIERRVARAEPMPACQPASRGAVGALDVTPWGGPDVACVAKTEARAALVSAVGCLRKVERWDEVPERERNLLRDRVLSAYALPSSALQRAGGAGGGQRFDQARAAASRMAELIATHIWVAESTVRVNGLDYVPARGAAVVIVRPGIFTGETPRLISSRVAITAPTDLPKELTLRRPEDLFLALNKAGMEISRVPIEQGIPFIPGTTLRGSVRVSLEDQRSRLKLRLQLPDDFRWETGAGVAVDAEMLATNRDGVRLDGFGVQNVRAQIAGVGVFLRYLRYVASQKRFEGSANVSFQPLGAIDGTLHVRGPRVELLNVTYFPGAPGIKVAPGVFLSEVNAFYENSPSAIRFGGNAAFTGGPSAGNGCGLVTTRGGFDFRLEPAPVTITVEGTGSIVCLPLFRARAVLAADGYVSVGAGIDYALGPFSLKAGWDVRYYDLRFTAEAGARGCVDDYGCIGGTALISDKGLAFCGDFGWFDAGAGLDWPPGPSIPAIIARLDIMFPSCDVGPWRTVAPRARAAQAGPPSVDVPAGGRGAVVGVVGAERAPRLRLRGPGGRVVEMPARGPVKTGRVVAFRVADRRTTFVALRDPGRWTLEVLDGTAIADVRRAPIDPDPVVRATVTRAGAAYVLRYTATGTTGQTVRFFERARGGMREIGRARGARGTLRFTPSDARGDAREIVALVERDGVPRAQLRVARFSAAGARIGRPRAVTVRRRGRTLVVGFRGAPNARTHVVGVELSDGRSLQLTAARGRRSVRVGGVARGTRVIVRVAGRRTQRGPVVTRRVRV